MYHRSIKFAFAFLQITGFLFFPIFAYARTPNDPQLSTARGMGLLQLPEAWDITEGSSDVVVAVIDTGVDITNPDLLENIWLNPQEKSDGIDNDGNGLIDDIHGWNFVKDNNDVRPVSFATSTNRIGLNHGTVVAGIVGAVGNNSKGGAGVNWHVRIMPLKILDELGDGDTDLAVKAIDYAIQKKVNIINLSFVGQTPSLDFIQAVRRAYRAGILVVAAAGNAPEGGSGINLNITPQYPVCFDDPLKEENWVIGVAALNGDGLLAPFSNFGSKCIDISAPGSRIPSTIFVDNSKLNPEIYGGSWSGTSIAAPFISGAASLVKSLQKTWGPDQIRKALFETVDSIPGNNDHAAGLGSLNVFKAVRYAQVGGDAGLKEGFFVASSLLNRTVVAHVFDAEFNETKAFALGTPRVVDVRLTTADIADSGVSQIIASVPDVKGSIVKIFQRDGKLLKDFRPFGNKERRGMSLASIDLENNGTDEIIVASDSLKRVAVLGANGESRTTIELPKTKGSVAVSASRVGGRAIIVTAIQNGKQVEVYEWDQFGTYISDFTLQLDTAIPISIGFLHGLNGENDLYVAQNTPRNFSARVVTLRGVLVKNIMAEPTSGTLFGFAFRQGSSQNEPELIMGSMKGKKPQFEIFNMNVNLGTPIENNRITQKKLINLYFGI